MKSAEYPFCQFYCTKKIHRYASQIYSLILKFLLHFSFKIFAFSSEIRSDPEPDPKLHERSDPDADPKKIISDPQHCSMAMRKGTVGKLCQLYIGKSLEGN